MIEYIVVFIVVGVAGYFVGRHLWREAKTGQCANCDCSSKNSIICADDSDRFPV